MAHSICNLKFNLPYEIPVFFHNGSKYDFHFIIKELANEFDCQFECNRENSEKHKTFSVSIKKQVVKIHKEGNKTTEIISCKTKFIDNMRFMATSLSNLVDNFTRRIHKLKCKICDCFLEFESAECNFRATK